MRREMKIYKNGIPEWDDEWEVKHRKLTAAGKTKEAFALWRAYLYTCYTDEYKEWLKKEMFEGDGMDPDDF